MNLSRRVLRSGGSLTDRPLRANRGLLWGLLTFWLHHYRGNGLLRHRVNWIRAMRFRGGLLRLRRSCLLCRSLRFRRLVGFYDRRSDLMLRSLEDKCHMTRLCVLT